MPSTEQTADGHPAVPSPALWVSLLGTPFWKRPDGKKVGLWSKDAALLAKLALDGPQSRGVLHALLWPEASPERAADNLRQRVSRLNRKTEITVIDLAGSVQLGPDVAIDIVQLEGLSSDVLVEAGDLLAGLDLGQNDDLDRWLSGARDQVAERCAKVLSERAESLEKGSRLHEALALAQRIVEWVPLGEHGWRRLMRLHYLRNDRAAAQEAFWRLTSILRDELGIRPSAETLQLMQTVEAADAVRAVSQQPVPASVRRPPVLIGRALAWREMVSAWQRPVPFLLIGEAGVGKSRLLEEFVLGADGVIAEQAQPGDERAPYALIGRILLQAGRRYAPNVPAPIRQELARLQPEFGEAAAGPPDPAVLWNATQRLLASSIERGLHAIVLDDLQDADPASIDLLRWLSASAVLKTLRIGMASRPASPGEPPTPMTVWLQASHRPVRVDVLPLTRSELSDFLTSLALPSLLDEGVAAQLYRHAGGHPLFTLATLQDAWSQGLDLHASSLPVPTSVQALLQSRLRGLPSAAQDLLRVAAVAGPDLTADRAARMLGQPLLEIADAWATLEAANVLHGEAFSHGLVRETALASVPRGVSQALHRRMAEILMEDEAIHPVRVAWHWERGERWAQAGRFLHLAGNAARRTGRLDEQIDLFEGAARAFETVADGASRFESLHARLDALQMRHGGGAVLAVLPEVEALADTGARRLRCRIARIEALLDGEQSGPAAAEAQAAIQEAAAYPEFLGSVGVMHAQALAQGGHVEPALAAAVDALRLSKAADEPLQTYKATSALGYVHFRAGRLAHAVEFQREAVSLAIQMGHRAEAATGEGHLAALLASIGDVPGTHAAAMRARDSHRGIGLAENSTAGIVNHIVLGAAAAALGRFDEALDALRAAVAMAGPQAAAAAQAKARLTLAGLWLTLGQPEAARELVESLASPVGPGMQIQVEWIRARAAEMSGLPSQRHWSALGDLARLHADLPLVQSAWFEISYQSGAADIVDTLARVRRDCESFGLHGTARALRWRELAGWLDIPGEHADRAIAEHAQALYPHLESGLSAKCYPPETWCTLARADGRVGDGTLGARCLDSARRWLGDALVHVPAAYRNSFLETNPINRRLLRTPTP